MFMQCSNKVQEKNREDPTKGTTVILNELLADESWLAQVFKSLIKNISKYLFNMKKIIITAF